MGLRPRSSPISPTRSRRPGGFIPAGNWIDPVYLISACFLGAVLWQPSAAPIESAQGIGERREIMVPAIFAAMMIGLAAMQYVEGASALSTVLWAGAMAAVVGRLAASVRENGRLLDQVQTDPLTGLGNRGRMHVDLGALAARATPENPVTLLFLDLNGFKQYNDTFGHVAGDDLLAAIGERLRIAVGADGRAYRVGGDEFCVLLTCERERCGDVIGAAAGALSVTSKGFKVDASLGAVSIPAEAADPAEALGLADMRMYAEKDSHQAVRTSRVKRSLSVAR